MSQKKPDEQGPMWGIVCFSESPLFYRLDSESLKKTQLTRENDTNPASNLFKLGVTLGSTNRVPSDPSGIDQKGLSDRAVEAIVSHMSLALLCSILSQGCSFLS